MQGPIVLYVWEEDGVVSVGDEGVLRQFGVDTDILLAASGEALNRYEVWLKEPLTHAMQMQVERACLTDPSQRSAAMAEAYIARWTLPGLPSAAGFNALHPNIADKLSFLLNARIFPLLGGQPDFFTLVNRIREEKGLEEKCLESSERAISHAA
jgi:hypothetical protein